MESELARMRPKEVARLGEPKSETKRPKKVSVLNKLAATLLLSLFDY